MSAQIIIHEDAHVGLTMGQAEVEEVHNHMGQHYFIARAPIGSIFGAEVHGELRGIGRTKEQAISRLNEETNKLAESLWV